MKRMSLLALTLILSVSCVYAFDLDIAKKGLSKVKEIDSDGDNQVNLAEFKKAGGKTKYFSKADTDKDGFISIKDAKKQLKKFY